MLTGNGKRGYLTHVGNFGSSSGYMYTFFLGFRDVLRFRQSSMIYSLKGPQPPSSDNWMTFWKYTLDTLEKGCRTTTKDVMSGKKMFQAALLDLEQRSMCTFRAHYHGWVYSGWQRPWKWSVQLERVPPFAVFFFVRVSQFHKVTAPS